MAASNVAAFTTGDFAVRMRPAADDAAVAGLAGLLVTPGAAP